MRMPGDFIFRMILGHLVGDYFLQNNWMALNKKDRFLPCFVHCILYTFAVCLFIHTELRMQFPNTMVLSVVGIFLSHFLIDYTNIVDRYLGWIGGRSWKNTERLIRKLINIYSPHICIAYSVIVSTVIDNTLHLMCMYYLFTFTIQF